jgi:phage baseplate assembly protein W
MVLIENENLLYQAALKILLTDRGSNTFHPWYGTYLRSRIGSKALAGVASLINEDVRRALRRIQTMQEQKAKYQAVSFKERMYSILSVNVLPHKQDPTTYMIDVVVQNAASTPIDLSIVFTVPEVVAMMGSNGLTLGNEIAGLNPPGTFLIPDSAILRVDGE